MIRFNNFFPKNQADDDLKALKIIETIYIELLKRNPDESGLQHYKELFKREGIERGVILMIRRLASSNEYKSICQNPTILFQSLKCNEKLINGLPVQHVISLGTHCLASSLIKMAGLKYYSTPFDWTYNKPQAVIHCIQDRFETFLDSSHYVQTTSEDQRHDRSAHHLWYQKNFGINHTFNHHNPLNEDDYGYFKRCAERFNRLLECHDTKLFVMISRPSLNIDNNFNDMVETLESKTLNSASIQISLSLNPSNLKFSQLKLHRSIGNHELYHFTPGSAERGLTFDSITDNLQILQLIRDYKLELKNEKSN